MKKIRLALIFLIFLASGGAKAQSMVGVHAQCIVGGGGLIDQICANNDWLSTRAGNYSPGQVVSNSVSGGYFTTESNSYLAETRVRANYGQLGVHSNVLLWNAIDDANKHSQAISVAKAFWTDVVTLKSDTLPNGTPVSVQITNVVDIGAVSSSSTGEVGWNPTGDAFSDIFFESAYQSSYRIRSGGDYGVSRQLIAGRNFLQYTVDLVVGQPVFWTVTLGSTAMIIIPSADYLGGGYGIGTASATATAFNSAHSYFTVINPGATLDFASGHDYSLSAVPEPSTLALVMLGILAFFPFAMRERRKSSHQRS